MKDALIALSIANLTMLTVWEDLAATRFFLVGPAVAAAPIAAVLNLTLLAAGLYGILRRLRRLREPYGAELRRVIVLLALILPVDWLRRQLGGPSFSSVVAESASSIVIVMALMTALAIPIVRRRTTAAVEIFLICVVPALAFSLYQAAMSLVAYPPGPEKVERIRSVNPTRIVWLVFDELDQRATFVSRPDGLSLPALDSLMKRSVVADNAYALYGGTIQALPALIAGERIERVAISGIDLYLKPEGGSAVAWRSKPGIFGWAHDRGLRTSVVGWYLPYCGVFSHLLTSCSSGSFLPEERQDLTIGNAMVRQIRRIAEKGPMLERLGISDLLYLEHLRRRDRAQHLSTFERVRREALSETANPDRDLVFVHWPIPHAPHVFDRASGRFTVERDMTYADSLALVDRTIAEVSDALARAGLRERTAILVTSDHWWRRARRIDRRVPFLVSMPGETAERHVSSQLSSLAMGRVAQAVLSGEARSADDIVGLLEKIAAEEGGSQAQ